LIAQNNRVVISGIGVVSPCGIGLDNFWKSLINGVSGVNTITSFDVSDHASKIAAQVEDFDFDKLSATKTKSNNLSRNAKMAIIACDLAIKDSNIVINKDSNFTDPVDLFIGVGYISVGFLEEQIVNLHSKGPKFVSPRTVSLTHPISVPKSIADLLGINCRIRTLNNACAAGLDAIGEAFEAIQRGEIEVAITGGSDSIICPITLASFTNAGLSSLKNEDPSSASRPFDSDADTGVVGEGSALFVVENLQHAIARKAKIYGEITAYSNASDEDNSKPCSGLKKCISIALNNSGRMTTDIDFISTHGAGAPPLDIGEINAIKELFGPHAYKTVLSSIKGNIGNPVAAGAPLQVAAGCKTFTENKIPFTKNLKKAHTECDLDIIKNKSRSFNGDCILINSHGVGGANGALILERYKDFS